MQLGSRDVNIRGLQVRSLLDNKSMQAVWHRGQLQHPRQVDKESRALYIKRYV
jgi:hypothetical protein